MPRQQRIKSESGYYHIMIRGNERRNIFNDDQDKLRFLETLNDKKQGNRFYIHGFCLMDNHVHLMISEGQDDIAKVMKRITVSYVIYFNKKYKRVGHLFQDRFKSEVVEDDAYVMSLTRYIHRNPVKSGMVTHPGEYKWSSYQSYIDDKNYFNKILDTETIMGLFSNNIKTARRMFIKYMNEESKDTFIDVQNDEDIFDEERGTELFKEMLKESVINSESMAKLQIPDELIREFKKKTNLSIRKIASITGVNKDKVNKIVKSI